jgi:hypothetical protein
VKKLGTIRKTPQPSNRSSAKQGYGYQHQRFRAALLRQRKLEAAKANQSPCEDCAAEGHAYEAHQRPLHLHHKAKVTDRPELQYEPSNCVFLCQQHHSKRTVRGE